MEYRKFDNVIIARIDKGEEILEQLKAIAINENIKLASINALGAINDFTIGVYKTDEKKYYSNSFKGYYEITSLTGTINTMDMLAEYGTFAMANNIAFDKLNTPEWGLVVAGVIISAIGMLMGSLLKKKRCK